jgi:zinc protease
VTPDEIRKMAQQYYGPVPARQLEPRAEFAEPPRLAETRMTVVRPDAKVPVFSRIYRVPSYATAMPGRAEGLEVYAQVLGGDQTSILYQVLVEQKKLATDAGASYDGMARDAGQFSVYAVPRPGVSLQTLEKAVDQVLASEAARPPAAADLARAKTQLVAATTYRRDSQYAMASAYGQALAIGMTVNDVEQWPDRIEKVDADAVKRAAAGLDIKEAVSAWLVPGGGK